MKNAKEVIVTALMFSYFANIPTSQSVFNTKLFDERIDIAVQFVFPDSIMKELIAENYFFDLLKSDFKKRGDKLKKQFYIHRADSTTENADFNLTIGFENLFIGDEKLEQTTRIASMTVSKTTHDKEIMEHKIGSENSRADVIRIKKSLPCTLTLITDLRDNHLQAIVMTKTFTGNYTWVKEYVTYNGPVELLTREEQRLTKNKDAQPPLKQELVKYLEQQIYPDIGGEFNNFFKAKKGF
jgi:hypothetical protein